MEVETSCHLQHFQLFPCVPWPSADIPVPLVSRPGDKMSISTEVVPIISCSAGVPRVIIAGPEPGAIRATIPGQIDTVARSLVDIAVSHAMLGVGSRRRAERCGEGQKDEFGMRL